MQKLLDYETSLKNSNPSNNMISITAQFSQKQCANKGISNNFFSSQQQITPRGSNTNNFTRETMKISFIRAIFRNSHWIRIGGPAIPRTILELFVNLIYDKPRHVANVCRLLLRPSPSIYNWESKHNVFITDFPTVYYIQEMLSLQNSSKLPFFPSFHLHSLPWDSFFHLINGRFGR